ncbi:MAG: general secretion pathway protein GspB [Desulfobacteraceae bacterium]|nr:general secretion pathway protein GspB [Desulfobacteraceae bacterium]MBC2756258.1 general secretion pathway protein GspB [Desulfobacteraceae bacterium]
MSAILKALKKLEQDTAANTGASSLGSIKGQNPRRSKSIIVPGLIVFSLCILTGVGISFFVQKPSAPESPTALFKDEKPVSAIKTQEKNENRNRVAEIDNQKQKKPVVAAPGVEFSTTHPILDDNRQTNYRNEIQKPMDAQTHGIPVSPPDSVRTADPFAAIMPTPTAEDESSQPIEENAEPAATRQPEISISESPVPVITDNIFSGEPVIRKTEPTVEILDDPSIDLQAISWSTDADKRMAIINGKICREKDRVAGYVVQAIHSGDVIISKGSVSGKLVFKIR